MRIIDEIMKLFEEKRLFVDDIEEKAGVVGTIIRFKIINGDWKHEHLRSKFIFKDFCKDNNYDIITECEYETYEQDWGESDCYSAWHEFVII